MLGRELAAWGRKKLARELEWLTAAAQLDELAWWPVLQRRVALSRPVLLEHAARRAQLVRLVSQQPAALE